LNYTIFIIFMERIISGAKARPQQRERHGFDRKRRGYDRSNGPRRGWK
jgi:hypothetical protein